MPQMLWKAIQRRSINMGRNALPLALKPTWHLELERIDATSQLRYMEPNSRPFLYWRLAVADYRLLFLPYDKWLNPLYCKANCWSSSAATVRPRPWGSLKTQRSRTHRYGLKFCGLWLWEICENVQMTQKTSSSICSINNLSGVDYLGTGFFGSPTRPLQRPRPVFQR
jgi:hypothetical protein